MVLDTLEAIAGGLLILLLPGLAWSRAIFPEWRIRGALAITHLVTTLTFAVVVSLALTIVVGSTLTGFAIAPYPAGWGDPVLEGILAAIALAGFVVALLRGGLRHGTLPGRASAPEPEGPPPEHALAEAARLRAEGRRIRHRLRDRDIAPRRREELDRQLAATEAAVRALERRREAEIDA
jgi:hypothetical protein